MSQRSGKRPPRLTAKPPHFKPHIPSTAGLPRLADLCAQHRHFQPVTRVRAAELTAEQLRGMIDVHVVEKGVPIVIEDAMAHFGWDAGFDAAWLEQNAGNIPVSLRDNRTQGDADAGSLAEAIKRLRAGKDPRDLLYGKDLNCPAEFTAELDRILPPFLRYMGENDYAHYLPKKLQPMNLMLYAGGDGTFTAGHYDIGGALGHNLMLQADPGAYALWFLFASDHKHIAEDIWKSQNHNSLNLDNYFMPISTLAEQGHRGIPIYVFEQRPGDFMILPGDCAHQVLNVGGFNLKISWNRTTAESLAVSYRETLPRYKASFKVSCENDEPRNEARR